jgi:hypothetical protein
MCLSSFLETHHTKCLGTTKPICTSRAGVLKFQGENYAFDSTSRAVAQDIFDRLVAHIDPVHCTTISLYRM